MNIEKELRDMADAKTGNKEIALFYDPCGEWRLDLGNPCQHVMLGEVEGEIQAEGETLEEAILNMWQKLGITRPTIPEQAGGEYYGTGQPYKGYGRDGDW